MSPTLVTPHTDTRPTCSSAGNPLSASHFPTACTDGVKIRCSGITHTSSHLSVCGPEAPRGRQAHEQMASPRNAASARGAVMHHRRRLCGQPTGHPTSPRAPIAHTRTRASEHSLPQAHWRSIVKCISATHKSTNQNQIKSNQMRKLTHGRVPQLLQHTRRTRSDHRPRGRRRVCRERHPRRRRRRRVRARWFVPRPSRP